MENQLSREQIFNLLALRHGQQRQEKIAQACIGIAGLGGIGSHVAVLLARMGVKSLVLVDFDKVDETNLHRQHYEMQDIGKDKTKALHAHLMHINPYIDYIFHTERIHSENCSHLFSSCDIICEAFDDAEQKAMLTETVLTKMPKSVLVASSGMAGIKSPNSLYVKKKMNNFYLCGDEKSDIKEEKSVFAPRVSLCASMQATVIIQIITNEIDLSL